MSLVSELQAFNIDFQHQATHEGQSEGSTLTFEKLDTDGSTIDLFSVTSFEYSDRDFEGRKLPEGTDYELRISEDEITDTDFIAASSIRHTRPQGTLRYSIIREGMKWPTGLVRFYRFWMTAAEVVADTTGDFVIDDAGNFLIDDAGNSVIWV